MPSKATVTGILLDANLDPVSAGKIIATLVGSDVFDGGARIVTQKIEATTNALGEWAVDLIVNAEGAASSTSWTVEGYNQYVTKVFEVKGVFIATDLPATLGNLELTSAQNLKASKDATLGRILIVANYAEYAALPPAQRRANDIVIVQGV